MAGGGPRQQTFSVTTTIAHVKKVRQVSWERQNEVASSRANRTPPTCARVAAVSAIKVQGLHIATPLGA
eukprot:scaffold4643_cov202-Prasinococcus_capsulatus_cf.AAC.1